MYAKLFSSLYQGTLRGKSHEILVFTNLLAHCDKEGYVDKHFRAIAEETGITQDDVKSAISILESPDEESRSNEAEGRRIVRIDDHRSWGWQVVNFVKYRAIVDEETRRETWRKSQAKRRACQHPSTVVNTSQQNSTQAEAEAEADSKEKKKKPSKMAIPSLEEVCQYLVEIGMEWNDGECLFLKWEENGWKNGSQPIKNWRMTAQRWKKEGWLSSQKKPQGQVNGSSHPFAGGFKNATSTGSRPLWD